MVSGHLKRSLVTYGRHSIGRGSFLSTRLQSTPSSKVLSFRRNWFCNVPKAVPVNITGDLPIEESIKVEPLETQFAMNNTLDSFDIHPIIRNTLRGRGINSLFEVQSKTYVAASEKKDLIVRAKTGSGKTLAFGLPTLTNILQTKAHESGRRVGAPLAIVLCPTRELAIQVHQELENASGGAVNGTCIYGGAPIGPQLNALSSMRKPIDFVVGTPGRIIDVLTNHSVLDLSEVKTVILDEADNMLKMDWKEDLEEILGHTSAETRQTLLFSATFPHEVRSIARSYMKDPETISLVTESDGRIPSEIEMLNIIVPPPVTTQVLSGVLGTYCDGGKKALVFCNTKAECDAIATSRETSVAGVDCVSLHGDMSQSLREQALGRFRSNRAQVLVATDVAARGLDIPEVDLVVHLGLPRQLEPFIHRTGRTGRAGRKGTNIVLHPPSESDQLRYFEKKSKCEFTQIKAPTMRDLKLKQLKASEGNITELLTSTNRSKKNAMLRDFRGSAESLVDSFFEEDQLEDEVKYKMVDLAAAIWSESTADGESGTIDSISAWTGVFNQTAVLVSNKNGEHTLGFSPKQQLEKVLLEMVPISATSFIKAVAVSNTPGQYIVELETKHAKHLLRGLEENEYDGDWLVQEAKVIPKHREVQGTTQNRRYSQSGNRGNSRGGSNYRSGQRNNHQSGNRGQFGKWSNNSRDRNEGQNRGHGRQNDQRGSNQGRRNQGSSRGRNQDPRNTRWW